MNLLTVKKVARLLRRGEPGHYRDGLGLFLVIKHKHNARWAHKYQLHGVAHEMGLGSAFLFTLHEARERNRTAAKLRADGVDPLVHKRATRATQAAAAAKTLVFKEAAQQYIAAHQSQWRNATHGRQWLRTLATYVFPLIGNFDIAAVDTPAVLRVLEQKVPAGAGYPGGQFWTVRAVTANRVRNRIELVLAWATARGYRSGDNPAAWSRLKHILPKPAKVALVSHHAAVPYAELPALMAQLREREGVAAQALRFTILTGARVGEVLGATWDEIDFDNAVWTIPGERMKGGREHKVPLSPPVVALLRELYHEDDSPHLFIGPRNDRLSDAALLAALRRVGRSETVHGFRSSFSDWAHERTAHSNHVIELSLAHTIGSAVEKAYRRSDLFDKRRKLMEQWAAFCTSPPAKPASVTPLRAARS